MITVLLWLLGVAIFLTALAISIGAHEAGHMFAARMFGLSVPRFFVGFGKTLYSKVHKGTEYGVKLIPLGGFVNIVDDKTEDEFEAQTLARVHPLKRIVVFAAGPLVNIVIAVVLLFGVLSFTEVTRPTLEIEKVSSCADFSVGKAVSCGGELAGVQVGDKFVSIDGVKVDDVANLSPLLKGKSHVKVEFERAGSHVVKEIDLTADKIGVDLKTVQSNLTVVESGKIIKNLIVESVKSIGSLPKTVPGLIDNIFGTNLSGRKVVTGDVPVNKPSVKPGAKPSADDSTPSSIIAIGKTYGDTVAGIDVSGSRVKTLLIYTALFNLGLGALNLLLPLLPLDSGRILVALIDLLRMGWSKVTGLLQRTFKRKVKAWVYKPLGNKVVTVMSYLMIVPIAFFFLLVTISDIALMIRGAL